MHMHIVDGRSLKALIRTCRLFYFLGLPNLLRTLVGPKREEHRFLAEKNQLGPQLHSRDNGTQFQLSP
jgi:hypothetical protein